MKYINVHRNGGHERPPLTIKILFKVGDRVE